MYHLLSCLRKKFYRYIGISVILSPTAGFLSPIAGFLSLVRVTQFSQFGKGICVLNQKYIKWKCFLGIL